MNLIMTMVSEVTTYEADSDVCILGAGTHGLAAALHLRRADPDLSITVVDPSGRWLSGWAAQFARAEIKTLRSPPVHHPAPDPHALSQFIRDQELTRSGLPYDLPTTHTFMQFCQAQIDDSALDAPLGFAPHTIRSRGNRVTIEAKEMRLNADHLIVASNPHRRILPDWVWPLLGHQPGLIEHGSDIDLAGLSTLDGTTVAIIGGGLTAAHLALGAAARGAEVQLISRRKLDVRPFDTAPGWLGPKYLTGFDAEMNPSHRLAILNSARAGGSIPKWMHARLTGFGGPGCIELRESIEVQHGDLDSSGGCHLYLGGGDRLKADRLWLATGTQADPYALRCIHPLLADVAQRQGLPILNEHLRLGPHRAFIMGRTAALTLGPAAGNLWGAQRGAERITQAITGVDLAGETATAISHS